MSDGAPAGGHGGRAGALPPLAAEDHSCAACGIAYAAVTIPEAVRAIRAVPERVRAQVRAVPPGLCRVRPQPRTWSVLEYVCHLRDVYVTSTIRLHRTRTEHRPALEPMFNDLRARRFRYNDRDLDAVLDELGATVDGFCEEVARVPDEAWERLATRLPEETRTARWLVRQAMHEGIHHLRDITEVGHAVMA